MSDPASKQYLANKVNPILEKLVIELVVKRPENITQFMINWLKDHGEKHEKNFSENQGSTQYHVDSDEHSSDEDHQDLMDVKALQKLKMEKAMRTSVSAEAYGKFNLQAEFKPKVIAKTQQQKDRIYNILQKAFMFQNLDEKQQFIIVDAMEEKRIQKGQVVIKQGDDGDCLFLVEQGELICEKILKKGEQPTFLRNYIPGESFGELALLYNAPRAATIYAKQDSVLFQLDRETFNHIVKSAAQKKREAYEVFFQKVEIMADLNEYERMQVADALKSHLYKKGDYIVKEGEVGDTFYILEEGEAIAVMNKDNNSTQQVYEYKPGMYFGERALLNHARRAASIIATSDTVKVVSLDMNSFNRLLGPLEQILKRNFSRYEQFKQ